MPYTQFKRHIPKPPKWVYAPTTKNKQTTSLIQQKTAEDINHLIYDDIICTTMLSSFKCEPESQLLQKLLLHMPMMLVPDSGETSLVVIDSGATVSVTYVKEDFVGTIHPTPFHHMQQLSESLDVMG